MPKHKYYTLLWNVHNYENIMNYHWKLFDAGRRANVWYGDFSSFRTVRKICKVAGGYKIFSFRNWVFLNHWIPKKMWWYFLVFVSNKTFKLIAFCLFLDLFREYSLGQFLELDRLFLRHKHGCVASRRESRVNNINIAIITDLESNLIRFLIF